jgi:HlyD family secretion protein
LAQQTLSRDRTLLHSGYIAQSQYDTDDSNLVAAQTALSTAVVTANQARMQLSAARNQATAGQAQGGAAGFQANGFTKTAAADLAAIDAAEAQVRQASINLSHTVITSPVNGTVIARNVSEGQTVAASFTTPTLYTIAKDLAKMEVDLAVGEPDIGTVRVGEQVDFTVLAYPDRTFRGIVAQVRENPTTIQNVVTYDTVVYEHNPDNSLRPGMTASAEIEVAHADNALVVPLAALSFRAPGQQPPARASAAPRATPSASTWGDTGTAQAPALAAGNLARVTVLDHGQLHAVPVRITLVSGGDAAIEPIGRSLPLGSQIAVSAGPAEETTAARLPGPTRL